MKKKLCLMLLALLLSFMPSTMAITLTTNEYYYLVVPKDAKTIKQAIYDASPMISDNSHTNQQLKSIGLHKASHGYNFSMKYNKKACYVDKVVVALDSKIYLPKIDMDAWQYTDTILTQFKIEARETEIHEREHRRIYTDELQRFANRLRGITKNNTTFANCDDLKKYVKTEYQRTSKNIEQQNLNFDCFEYGKKFNLDMCKSATVAGQKTEKAPMTSLSQGGESDVKSFKDKEKPTESECNGKLIEPFKGKFYCVPNDSYSE